MHFNLHILLAVACLGVAFGLPFQSNDQPNAGQLFEGDILLSRTQEAQLNQRNAVLNTDRWSRNQIPYIIDEGRIVDASHKALINQVVNFYNTKTCIQWIRRTTQNSFVNITRFGDGCYSYVGQISAQASQILHLAPNCMHFQTVAHEMMHAIGFFHEQSRPDRDGYVNIVLENVQPGYEHAFEKYTVAQVQTLGAPYDFDSVMHYGPLYFSKNGRPTIIARKPGANIGLATTLSAIDLFKVNKLYNCASQIAGSTFNPSQFNTFPPLASTTPMPTASVPFRCTFDDGMCGFQDVLSVFTWTRNRGQTPTAGTGPTQASTAANGYYMYTEASGRLPDDSALLITPQFVVSGTSCVTFKYHMYGSTMGRLEVDLIYGGNQKYALARLSGDRGNQWLLHKASFLYSGPVRVLFSGYIGRGYFSDMAIDDVNLKNGNCN